jgi:hypothetical protein
MRNFDLSDTDINETTTPHVAWCANCDGPTDLDGNGECVACRDSGERNDVELVVPESIPSTSPRSIECSLCGADPGEFCHPGEDGSGYNHAARVEEHEDQHGVIAARERRYA